MIANILIDGQAGQGPNTLAKVIGKCLVKWGYFVFVSRDYGSFIRGGHNCNALTLSDKPIMSNIKKVDILVSLDKSAENSHKPEISKNSIVIENDGEDNMYFAGKLLKLLGIDFDLLKAELQKLKKFEENLKHAKKGYDEEKTKLQLKKISSKAYLMDGANGVAQGAIKSGLDVYFAYPMTPATSLLNELAEKQNENNYLVLELENEISVINTAIGSAIAGAKSMIGTSGGGFDLMTEALSLTGIAQVPLVAYLAQRPGPATGAPTYTSQGDLNMALGAGHGEFSRLVVAPGEPSEAQALTNQAFHFSQKYKIPCIILSDKHLAESLYTLGEEPKLIPVPKSASLRKYNSYECDEKGIATENADLIKKNAENRLKKQKEIEKEAKKFEMFKIHGKKDSKNLVLFWGSTKGAVLDAIRDLDVKALQILYMEPFPEQIKSELEKAKNILIVENNSTSPLSSLIAEKTGIFIEDRNKILRYDGRPFLSDELNEEIKRRIK